jgi:hypothetical protein
MKLSDVLFTRIYTVPGSFANLERFVSQVSRRLDLADEVTPSDCENLVRDAVSSLRSGSVVETDREAEERLLADELERLFFENGSFAWSEDDAVGIETRLQECVPIVYNRLERIGLHAVEMPLRIVDRFPEPFDQFDWSAFAPDNQDQEQFAIRPGIYFRRDRLRPLYSEALLAHEVIHTLTGEIDPEIYATGLEEGIAEVVGSCYAALGSMPVHVLRNILVYGRHGCARSKLWSVYLDHTRQAYLLFNKYGLRGLADIISRGRSFIHDIERELITGDDIHLDIDVGLFDSETRDLLDFHCCSYVPSHVFAPLEYLLIRHVQQGRDLKEICDRAGVRSSIGREVLQKLGSVSALFVQSRGEVVFSNVERYRAVENLRGPRVLRYLPSSDTAA